jgi:glycosyltransferase involved in cell wall biosynthesis
MQLDVIVPTHNRRELLGRALDSLFSAHVPPGLLVRVTVVDNNSTDDTREYVLARASKAGGMLSYLFEPRIGKPYALNAGIGSTQGDLVGLIDDDEEIESNWYRCIEAAFRDDTLDFIGGRCLPRWGADLPPWFGRHYRAVIGWVEIGDQARDFDGRLPGMLTGGNAVLTRAILNRVGPYSTALCRTPTRLMGAEDEHLYYRLLRVGARGRYFPDLIIYHYVPAERLTKGYFRRWSFWCGVSRALIDAEYPAEVPYLAGVPRYLIGGALRGAARAVRGVMTRDVPLDTRFASELDVWDLAGFFYGKHLYRGRDTHTDGGPRRCECPRTDPREDLGVPLVQPEVRCEREGA